MLLQKKVWLPILIALLAVIGCGLFYARQVSKQEPVKVYKVVEVEKPKTPKPPPPGETVESGHWHGDEWHSEKHNPPSPAESTETQTPRQHTTGGGYWTNGTWHPPAGYVPAHPRGRTSSNPLFKDGVPEHLKCPEKWIGVYFWGTSEAEAAREKVKQIGLEVMEQYNPKRPIHEVWPRFINDELFYQANADFPPLDPERYPPGSFAEWSAAPERIEAVDRVDWLVQHALDYPEVIKVIIEDGAMYTNAWRMELGFDPPNWNVVTLPDGREFHEKSGYRYEFTYTDGDQTFISTSTHSADPNAPLVRINLNETSDEELEALGIDYSIIPYRLGGE